MAVRYLISDEIKVHMADGNDSDSLSESFAYFREALQKSFLLGWRVQAFILCCYYSKITYVTVQESCIQK